MSVTEGATLPVPPGALLTCGEDRARVESVRLLVGGHAGTSVELTLEDGDPDWIRDHLRLGRERLYRIGSWEVRATPYAVGAVPDGKTLVYMSVTQTVRREPASATFSPPVHNLAEIVQRHLEETMPVKGPWGHYDRAGIWSRISEKFYILNSWAADHKAESAPQTQDPRGDWEKLLCRLLIAGDVEGWLHPDGGMYGTL